MKVQTLIGVTLGAWIVVFTSSAVSQSATILSLPPPPAGFKVIESSSGLTAALKAAGTENISAEKSNADWPGCIDDPKIGFTYGWVALPGGDKIIEFLAQAPEDPAKQSMGFIDEPLGKKRYKGGVLSWRKRGIPYVGAGKCREDPIVTYTGSWTGYSSGKQIHIGVSNLHGSKETGQAWIAEYIDKVIAAATEKK